MSRARLCVVATTDLHGQLRDHDYGTDGPYADAYGNRIGLARVATVVRRVRAAAPHALLVDAGDLLEGSALAHHWSRRLAEPDPPLHPVAAAMNLLGYDAVTLGNHELDYGVRALERFRDQLDAPLLGGNVRDAATGLPAFDGAVLRDVPTDDGPPVRVGIVGLTTPRVTAWNRDVAAHYLFGDLVASAGPLVEDLRARGAEVVVAVVHSGIVEPPPPVEPPLLVEPPPPVEPVETPPENAALDLARTVPGIDAVVAGHAHVEVAQRRVTGPDGREVVLTEPLCWGMRVSVVELDLARAGERWRVAGSRARLVDTRSVEEDPELVRLVAPAHDHVRALGARVVGSTAVRIDTEPARYRPTTALDLVAHAQTAGARRALTATLADVVASYPLLALVNPTNRFAAIEPGPVRRRQVAALCQFDSGVVVVRMDGRALRAHLEHAATFFAAIDGRGPHHPDALTNAPTAHAPSGTPDFDYDVLYGADADVSYRIDLSRPAGRRVRELRHGGVPIGDGDRFAVAVTRYRGSGAASYPDVSRAPVLAEVPQTLRALVESVLADGPWTGAARSDWRLEHDGSPVRLSAAAG